MAPRNTDADMVDLRFWGKPLVTMEREELYAVIAYQQRRLDDAAVSNRNLAMIRGSGRLTRHG